LVFFIAYFQFEVFMRKFSHSIPMTAMAVLAAFALPAYANPVVSGGAPCSTSDVQVTTVTRSDGTPIPPLPAAVNSAECTGADVHNATPLPTTNLGYYGDGLFNGAAQNVTNLQLFPNGIFSDQYTAHDLNHDGKPDPGWVYLGSWDGSSGKFTPGTFNGASIAGSSSWFTATGIGASSGTWNFNVPVDIVAKMSAIFGSNLFDQFAMSFFAGDYFSAYDITGAEFGLPTQSYPIYSFGGTWDTTNTLVNNGGRPAAISHIDLYARDPANPGATTNVPEPGSMALVALGLAGLAFTARRRAR
jgi:hypothetical protein